MRPLPSLPVTLVAALAALACDHSDAGAAKKRKPGQAGKPATAAPAPAGAALVPAPAAIADTLELRVVVRKLESPVDLEAAPGDRSGRLYVVEKVGRIRLLEGGALVERPFLDMTARVSKGSEQGLLGLAFHPKFADNGRFYLNYTDGKGDTHIVEMRVDPKDPGRADPASERELVFVDQPYSNHNGGHLQFGPDGKLWVGLGDGGAANDPKGHGQKDGTLLGKMFRVDVDAREPKPEVVAKGLRNPWRYTFDPKTGDLYVADVGQDKWEEVSVVAAAEAQKGGQNFGWNLMEGSHCFAQKGCDGKGLVLPVVEYAHADGSGCSVTGGEVYRGAAIPALDGAYFYADYCTGLLRSFRWKAGAVADHWDWKKALDPRGRLATVSAFGRDAGGELYIVSLDGVIWKLARK
jgi:glucose/arabinose dehydrogenase